MGLIRDQLIDLLSQDSCPLLTVDELAVLDLRFGLTSSNPLSLQAVGAQLGRTREAVRQIEKAALQKLSEKFRTN